MSSNTLLLVRPQLVGTLVLTGDDKRVGVQLSVQLLVSFIPLPSV